MNTPSRFKELLRKLDRRVLKGRLFLLSHASLRQNYSHILRMSERPIFIGGCGRSGTSLLLSLVSVLPRVFAFSEETKAFCGEEYPVSSGTSQPSEPHIDFVYGRFAGKGEDLRRYTRWCEKTPKNIVVVDRLLEYFGEGMRFIHIVRDGRDVVTSTHPRNRDRYWTSPERWISDVSAGRAAERHPQVMAVRYEDLTAEPVQTMQRICAFLGESFDEERFRAYPESAQFGTGDFFNKDTGREDLENEGVHRESVERWKKEEHAEVIEELLASDRARRLLQHYGYLDG